MPQVTNVAKARKAQGACGKCGAKIKQGDPYRWWKFRFGGRYVRCGKPECSPRASDLTQSSFYSTLYDIQDSLSDAVSNRDADALRSAADELRSLGEECSSNRDNMPEGLQESDTGNLLQERADECDNRASEIESAADELDDAPNPDEWEAYVEENSVERNEGETDDEFRERVLGDIETELSSQWESVDIDLSIS